LPADRPLILGLSSWLSAQKTDAGVLSACANCLAYCNVKVCHM